MAVLRMYRTTGYNWLDKDPIIDKARTVLQDENLFSKLGLVHELSGVATSTLNNWFHGDTKRPNNATVDAVLTSLGYERTIRKTETLDYEKERIVARRWRERQEKKNGSKPRTNGHARRSQKT